MATPNKRLTKEFNDIKKQEKKVYTVAAQGDDLSSWDVKICPDQPPYNKGAFRVSLVFPPEYPFKPPKLSFKTKIYHPNIDEKGQVCLPIIQPDNWKPATKAEQVLASLLLLIDEPEPEHPLRADVAEEYTKDKKKFMKTAEEQTKKFAEKRDS